MESFIKSVTKWLKNANERVTLQRFYLILAGLAFILANLTSLFDNNLGRKILFFSLGFLAIFVVNFIIWAIGTSMFENIKSSSNSQNSKKK